MTQHYKVVWFEDDEDYEAEYPEGALVDYYEDRTEAKRAAEGECKARGGKCVVFVVYAGQSGDMDHIETVTP